MVKADLCATVRERSAGRERRRFGFSPKISTPVENTVENSAIQSSSMQKRLISGRFPGGEARKPATVRHSAAMPVIF